MFDSNSLPIPQEDLDNLILSIRIAAKEVQRRDKPTQFIYSLKHEHSTQEVIDILKEKFVFEVEGTEMTVFLPPKPF